MVKNGSSYWEDVQACDFCGGTERKLYMESSVPHWYRQQPMRLEACTNCGLVFASPRPSLEKLHGDYFAGGPTSQKAVERKLKRPRVREMHRKAIKKAIRQLGYQPERLYDMGCGAGTTLMEAQALGIEAWGNDINKAAVDMLNGVGCTVRHGFSKDLDLPSSHFDIVFNFDYLEHSFTPLEDLRKCFELTKPGGILCLKTLYLDCPQHKDKGEAWGLFGPGHFHFFTADVLQAMIESVGYEIFDVELGELIFITARRPKPGDEQKPGTRPKPRVRSRMWQRARNAIGQLTDLGSSSR